MTSNQKKILGYLIEECVEASVFDLEPYEVDDFDPVDDIDEVTHADVMTLAEFMCEVAK